MRSLSIVLAFATISLNTAYATQLPTLVRPDAALAHLPLAETGGLAPGMLAASANWIDGDKLLGTPDALGDQFGYSVSTSGNRIAVGVRSASCAAGLVCGSVHVFTLIDGQWVQEAILTASTPQPSSQFGYSVDIDGNSLIVGAPFETRSGTGNDGNAYLFKLQGGSWVPVALTTPIQGGTQLGSSVAISDFGIAVASMPLQSQAPNFTNNGAVATFTRDAGGNWSFESLLRPTAPQSNAVFGRSVSIYTYTILNGAVVSGYAMGVGATGATIFGNLNAGAGYVFTRGPSDMAWVQGASYSLGAGSHESENFGSSVSVFGSTIAFGIPRRQDTSGHTYGAVYIVRRNSANWSDFGASAVSAASGNDGDFFGASVAIWKDSLFVGVPNARYYTFPIGTFYPNAGHVVEYEYRTDFGDPSAIWHLVTTHFASDPNGDAFAGFCTAYRGFRPVFGASGALDATETSHSGAVYVLTSDDIFGDGFE
jgi:FG-GAP repeat